MNPEEYEKMFAVEDRHWWFSGKRRMVRAFLRNTAVPRDAKILDVGCGTGGMHILLKEYGSITGVDGSPIALSFNRKRGLADLSLGHLPNLPFRDASFDFITIFDVLYHRNVADDGDAARELFRLLRPGGLLLVTDSALPALAGPHDVSMHGVRRYTRRSLRDLLSRAGFAVERSSYMNFLLSPVSIPWRFIQKWMGSGGDTGHSDVKAASGFANFILGIVYGVESFLLRYINFPIGTSVIAVARKPAAER